MGNYQGEQGLHRYRDDTSGLGPRGKKERQAEGQ